jgi:hypothetical protein
MRKFLAFAVVAGLAGAACADSSQLAGPTAASVPAVRADANGKCNASGSSCPEVPSGQHPQPNPNKSRHTH